MEFLSIMILVFLFIVGLFASFEFSDIAAQKGHDGSKYFFWCFIGGLIGYLMVVALPDRRNTVSTRIEYRPPVDHTPVPAAKPMNPPPAVTSNIPVPATSVSGDPVSPIIVDEFSVKCPNCGTIQKAGRLLCYKCALHFVP